MDQLPSPVITPLARNWLESHDPHSDVAQRVLFQTIDGRRNVIELESVARALGMQNDAIESLHRAGMISFDC